MDQCTRRVIGFGVHSGIVNGVALCRMFHRAIRGQRLAKYLSSDHDPLYRFHQWQANLRILEVTETLMDIERMPDWKDACQNRVLADRHHQSISIRTAGGSTVEACTRPQLLHDFINSPSTRDLSRTIVGAYSPEWLSKRQLLRPAALTGDLVHCPQTRATLVPACNHATKVFADDCVF